MKLLFAQAAHAHWRQWRRHRALASSPWESLTYWALDLETSGLKPRRDVILSVGMVPIRGGAVAWGDRFYSLARPPRGAVIDPDAMRTHHILPRELEAAPPIAEVFAAAMARLGRDVLLVHHAAFDLAFLRRACRGFGCVWPEPPIVDTVRLLARLRHRREQLEPYARELPMGLGRARKDLGLPAYDYHHALGDALATAELFLVLRARLGIVRFGQI